MAWGDSCALLLAMRVLVQTRNVWRSGGAGALHAGANWAAQVGTRVQGPIAGPPRLIRSLGIAPRTHPIMLQ